MDFSISGSNDWEDDQVSVSLHEQLFRSTSVSINSDISVNTTKRKKNKLKRKLHELTDCDNSRDVHLPTKKADSTEVTEPTAEEPVTPKKLSKKKKKKKVKDLSNSLASEEKSMLSNNEKQDLNKSKLLQYEQDGDHVKTKDRLHIGTDSTEVTGPTAEESVTPKKVSKKEKKKKVKDLSNSLAYEEKNMLPNNEKQDLNKPKLLQYEQDGDHVRTEDRLPIAIDSTEITEPADKESVTPKKLRKKKKKKKIKDLSNSLAPEEKSMLPNNEKQGLNKSQLLQYEHDGDHLGTEDRLAVGTKSKKLIIGKETSCEVIKEMLHSEQMTSECQKTSKHKKRKRKHSKELSGSNSNIKQKLEVEQQPVMNSKDKGLGSVKTHQLSPTKLQNILKKYDTPTQEGIQKPATDKSASSVLKERAMKRLEAAKFRFLNEKMYTVTGREALEYFQNDPEAFEEYHSGYQSQVKKWPVNPVDLIIADLQKKPKSFVIADLGCGDAKIARVLYNRTVHSFDFVPLNDKVICCDISEVPMGDGSVNVAVFCLSLMGTNLADYILESHRILTDGGLLKIAEVESRIKDLDEFIANIEKYGFSLMSKDTKHKMFVLMDFCKVTRKVKKSKLPEIQMDPCIYKKR